MSAATSVWPRSFRCVSSSSSHVRRQLEDFPRLYLDWLCDLSSPRDQRCRPGCEQLSHNLSLSLPPFLSCGPKHHLTPSHNCSDVIRISTRYLPHMLALILA